MKTNNGTIFTATLPVILIVIIMTLFLTGCQVKKDDPTTGIPEPTQTEPTESQRQLINSLNEIIIPINGPSPSLDHGDLSALDFLGDTRMVGLGEATHGTKEFFQMKHRLLKYFVEVHGFKVFAIEADFEESLWFENYVINGEGNLVQLMRSKMHFWTWKTEEVKEMIQWMYEYNRDKEYKDKIHYMGFDCQNGDRYPSAVMERLQTMTPDLTSTWASIQKDYIAQNQKPEVSTFTPRLDDFLEQLEQYTPTFTGTTQEMEFFILKQLVTVFKQTVMQSHPDSGFNSRDRYMAENARWIADLYGKDTKMVLWAHNGHVMISRGDLTTMGENLRAALDTNYMNVGFSFSTGSLTAYGNNGFTAYSIKEEPLPESSNFLFHHCKYQQFILRMEDSQKDQQLTHWFDELNLFMSIGSVFHSETHNRYYEHQLNKSYNVIIHLDKTTHSEIL